MISGGLMGEPPSDGIDGPDRIYETWGVVICETFVGHLPEGVGPFQIREEVKLIELGTPFAAEPVDIFAGEKPAIHECAEHPLIGDVVAQKRPIVAALRGLYRWD